MLRLAYHWRSHHNRSDQPRGPPDTPHDHLRPHAPDVPPERRFDKNVLHRYIPVHGASQEYSEGRNQVQRHASSKRYRRPQRTERNERQRRWDETDKECQREIKRGKSGKEHAEEKQGKRFNNKVPLWTWREIAGKNCRREAGPEEVQECEREHVCCDSLKAESVTPRVPERSRAYLVRAMVEYIKRDDTKEMGTGHQGQGQKQLPLYNDKGFLRCNGNHSIILDDF